MDQIKSSCDYADLAKQAMQEYKRSIVENALELMVAELFCESSSFTATV